jgi:hypothetical protein
MANSIRIAATLSDQVSSPLQKITDKFDQLGKSKGAQSILQGLGVGLGISAYGLLTSAIGDVKGALESAVSGAEAEQAAMAKLSAAFTAQGLDLKSYATQIDAAQTAGAALGFTQKDQTDALGLTIVATRNATDALRLQRDAMDIARLKGVDLATAELALNKGYDGTTTALNRMGIQIAKGSKGVEVLTAVEKAAGGQATAFANTAEGAMAAASASMDKAANELGAAFLPAITTVATAFSDMLSGFAEQTQTNDTNLTNMLTNATTAQMEGVKAALENGIRQIQTSPSFNLASMLGLAGGAGDAATAMSVELEKVNLALAMGKPTLDRGADRAFSGIPAAADKAVNEAVDFAASTGAQISDALTSGQSAVDAAATALANALKHPLDVAAREATLMGQLTGQNLVNGLASTDPLARAAAEKEKELILAQLANLEGAATQYGYNTGTAYLDAMAKAMENSTRIAEALARLKHKLQAFSPPSDPWNPLHDIGKWGFNIGKHYIDQIAGGMGVTTGIGSTLGGLAGGFMGRNVGHGGPVPTGAGGVLVHLEVHGSLSATPAETRRLSEALGQAVRLQLARRS